MPLSTEEIADNWLRYLLKGFEGFSGHVINHAQHRPLTDEERAMLLHCIERLQKALDTKCAE